MRMAKPSGVTFSEKPPLTMDGKPKNPSNRPIYAINVKLIPLKLLIFFFYGGMAGLYPFLTLHMKALGLTITETAIIYALLPVLCAVGPLSTGWAADRLGNCKIILVISIIFNILLHTMMYVGVPVYNVTHVPDNFTDRSVVFSLPCNNQSVWTVPEFLQFPNASHEVPCVNATSSPAVLASLVTPSACTSTCRTNPDMLSGKFTVCLKELGCLQIADVFEKYGFREPVVGNFLDSTHSKNNSKIEHAICLKPGVDVCEIKCSFGEPIPATCLKETVIGNHALTFWSYFIFRVLASIGLASVLPLVDAAMIQMTHDHNGNIGLQRMWTLVAMTVWPPLAGLMIDSLGYAPAFYLYDVLHGIAAILAIIMSLNLKIPAHDIWTNVWTLLKNPRVVAFIFVVFFIGTAFGMLDSFLFWFMEEDLQSPKWMLGITNTVGGLCGIPVVASATYIIKRTGHTNILIFSMFVFGIRYIGYSFVYNAYLILPLEALEAFSNGLMWVTATIYTSKMAGPAYLATLQGIVGGMHYGIGRGAGALMGGLMIKSYGARHTWRVFGYICFGCGTLYAALQYFWLRRVKLPGQTTPHYQTPESLKHMEILTTQSELKPMNEEEEEMLHETALLNIIRATSSVDVDVMGTNNMGHHHDHNLMHRGSKSSKSSKTTEHEEPHDEEHIFDYDEKSSTWAEQEFHPAVDEVVQQKYR